MLLKIGSSLGDNGKKNSHPTNLSQFFMVTIQARNHEKWCVPFMFSPNHDDNHKHKRNIRYIPLKKKTPKKTHTHTHKHTHTHNTHTHIIHTHTHFPKRKKYCFPRTLHLSRAIFLWNILWNLVFVVGDLLRFSMISSKLPRQHKAK